MTRRMVLAGTVVLALGLGAFGIYLSGGADPVSAPDSVRSAAGTGEPSTAMVPSIIGDGRSHGPAASPATTPEPRTDGVETIFGHIVSVGFLPGYQEDASTAGTSSIGPLTIDVEDKGSFLVPGGLRIRKSCVELRSEYPEGLDPCFVRLDVTPDRTVTDLLVLWTTLDDPADPASEVLDVYMVGYVTAATPYEVTVSIGEQTWGFPLAEGLRYVCGSRATPPTQMQLEPPPYSYLSVDIDAGEVVRMECRV